MVVLFLAEFFHPITAINVDLGRHLLLGKIIALTHHVPQTNLLSYTYPNFPYINTSWLSDVVYYFLFTIGGFDLLLLANTFIIAVAFGLLVFIAVKKNGLTFITLFASALYLLLLGLRPDIRPEVMSMLCLSLFMILLYTTRKTDKKILFFLIPIELFWVNLHIYFFVGPMLVLLFLFDFLIRNSFQYVKAKIYFIVLIGTIIATILNPNGLKGALFPFTVFNNYGFPIVENQSFLRLFSVYHSSEILLPGILILLLFTVLFLARKNTRSIDWLLAIVFSLAAFFIFRNILLFVFTTFLSFTTQLNFLVKKYHTVWKNLPKVSYILIYPLSLVFLILFILSSLSNNGLGFGVQANGEKAVNFLIVNKIKGPIYNNFDIGDYLSYRLYPQKVFIENRPEAYPSSFFKQIYIPMQNNFEIFQKIDKKYLFNAIVISYWDDTPWGSELLKYLVNNSNFKLIYFDENTIILIRNTQLGKALITKYQIKEQGLEINNSKTQQELIHYLFFFEKVGWTQQELVILGLIREIDPQLCVLETYPLEKSYIQQYINTQKLNKNCPELLFTK